MRVSIDQHILLKNMNYNILCKYKVNVFIIISILTFMGMFFYFLNDNVVNRSDDIYYCYKYLPYNKYKLPQPIDPNHKITNLQDIFESQINHYQSLNGRFVVHCIVQLFCGILNKHIFNIFTTGVFVLFLICICKLNNLTIKKHATYWLISIAFIWLLMPYPACLTLNIAFAINYLWAPFLCLLFCYFYRGNCNCKNTIYYIFYFLFSFLAGQSHEGFTIGISGYLFVDLIFNYRSLSKKHIAMAVGFMIGTLLLIISPANFRQVLNNASCNHDILYFFSNRLIVFEKLRRFWIFFFFAIILYMFKRKTTLFYIIKNKDLSIALVFQLLFNLVIGFQRERALFGIELYSLILFVGLLIFLLEKNRVISLSISLISLLILIVVNIGILKTSNMVNDEYDGIIKEFRSNPYGVAHFKSFKINKYYSSYVNRFSSPQWEYDAISFKYNKKIRME